MRRLLLATSILVGMLLAASCRQVKPHFDSPLNPQRDLLAASAGAPELLDLLGTRAEPQATLWSGGQVVLRQRDVKGKAWFNATILYKDPDRIRLRGSRVPIGTLFEVILLGEQAGVHLNRESELYVGTLGELREQGGLAGSLSLREMMAAILVNQDLRERLESGSRWKPVRRDGDDLLLEQEQPDWRRITWRVRRSDGLVSEIVTREMNGREILRVTYSGYRIEKGAGLLPSAFDVSLYEGIMTVSVRIDEYKIAPTIPAAVWMMPNARTREPLSALANRESPVPVEAETAPQ